MSVLRNRGRPAESRTRASDLQGLSCVLLFPGNPNDQLRLAPLVVSQCGAFPRAQQGHAHCANHYRL